VPSVPNAKPGQKFLTRFCVSSLSLVERRTSFAIETSDSVEATTGVSTSSTNEDPLVERRTSFAVETSEPVEITTWVSTSSTNAIPLVERRTSFAVETS
jgi:hypothetical protein